MNQLTRILDSLRRLNDLQVSPRAIWVRGLTPRERKLAVEHAREGLPTAILGHHDRLVARGKRSLAPVRGRVCGACHLALPSGHQAPQARGGDLDVCDHCGVFLTWLPPVPSPSASPVRTRGKKS